MHSKRAKQKLVRFLANAVSLMGCEHSLSLTPVDPTFREGI